jgi:DnaJ-domain-containing protein 1
LQQAVQDQPWVDPATQALQQRLEAVQSKLDQFERGGQQQQQQATLAQIEQFRTATDQNGQLLHPFLNAQVLQDMVHFYTSGRAQDPETAYKLAVQYDPEYQAHAAKAAEQKAIEAARQQQQQQQQRQQITGKPSVGTDRGNTGGKISLDDAVNEAMAAARNR